RLCGKSVRQGQALRNLGWNPSRLRRKGGTYGPAGLSKQGREVRWQANGKKKSSGGANGKNPDCRPRPGSRAKRPGKNGPQRPRLKLQRTSLRQTFSARRASSDRAGAPAYGPRYANEAPNPIPVVGPAYSIDS